MCVFITDILFKSQDKTAAETVAFWATLQKNDKIRDLALEQSKLMAAWPDRGTADLPDKLTLPGVYSF